jgi:hypothetical protein
MGGEDKIVDFFDGLVKPPTIRAFLRSFSETRARTPKQQIAVSIAANLSSSGVLSLHLGDFCNSEFDFAFLNEENAAGKWEFQGDICTISDINGNVNVATMEMNGYHPPSKTTMKISPTTVDATFGEIGGRIALSLSEPTAPTGAIRFPPYFYAASILPFNYWNAVFTYLPSSSSSFARSKEGAKEDRKSKGKPAPAPFHIEMLVYLNNRSIVLKPSTFADIVQSNGSPLKLISYKNTTIFLDTWKFSDDIEIYSSPTSNTPAIIARPTSILFDIPEFDGDLREYRLTGVLRGEVGIETVDLEFRDGVVTTIADGAIVLYDARLVTTRNDYSPTIEAWTSVADSGSQVIFYFYFYLIFKKKLMGFLDSCRIGSSLVAASVVWGAK